MYSVCHCSLFGDTSIFYKDGIVVGYKQDGKLTLQPGASSYKVAMTRSQGFRYWERHFPERCSDSLPALIQEAVLIDPKEEAEVCYFQKTSGQIIKGYR